MSRPCSILALKRLALKRLAPKRHAPKTKAEPRAWVAGLAFFAGLLLGDLFAATAEAQVLRPADEQPPNVYRVGELELEYANPHPDQPSLDGLVPLDVELRRTERGFAAPVEGQPTEQVEIGGPGDPIVPLETSGLARVLGALVAGLNRLGLYGVDVRPAETDIDLSTEQDLRPAERTALAIRVHTGRIAQIRTIAVGDRIKGDWTIDNTLHEKIRLDSPLQPVGEGDEGTTDLLDRHRLEDYLHRLNRYSGRNVEAALSPGEKPGDIVLDYRVMEAKPWYVYGQATNTGTTRTNPWQSRFGYAHSQLTNRDDTLSIDYLNAGLNDVNGLNARYESRFFGAKRPEWMDRRKGDPDWIAWLPREKIPWWGVDRLRWGVDFGWNRSIAGRDSTFQGLANDPVRSTQWTGGGHFTYQLFQHRDFFVDVIPGLSLSDLRVENGTSESVGEALLVQPRLALHAERITQLATFLADTGVTGQVNPIRNGDLATLGRADTDARYATLDFNFGYSAFLEPLLRPEAWSDPSNELSATLAHEVSVGFRGQYGFDYRLIPQASQTLGGLFSVRGYDQSVAVGDTVLVGTFEYRFHLPRALPVARRPLQLPLIGDFRVAPQQVYGRPDWDLMFRAFVDAGRAIRTRNHLQEFDQTLVGAGVGAEFVFRSNLRIRADYAFPLNDTNGDIKNSASVGDSTLHVLFSILY
jgi:hypothetical protein